eukprot:SAG22_NODE_11933_length_463_cov_0.706044_1_plen_47_part_00
MEQLGAELPAGASSAGVLAGGDEECEQARAAVKKHMRKTLEDELDG